MKILVNAMTSKMGGARVMANSFLENIDENDGNEYYFMVYSALAARFGASIIIYRFAAQVVIAAASSIPVSASVIE